MNLFRKLPALLLFALIAICSCKKTNDGVLQYTSKMAGTRIWTGTYNNGYVTDTAAVTIVNNTTVVFMGDTLTFASTSNFSTMTFSSMFFYNYYPADVAICQLVYYYNVNKVYYTCADSVPHSGYSTIIESLSSD